MNEIPENDQEATQVEVAQEETAQDCPALTGEALQKFLNSPLELGEAAPWTWVYQELYRIQQKMAALDTSVHRVNHKISCAEEAMDKPKRALSHFQMATLHLQGTDAILIDLRRMLVETHSRIDRQLKEGAKDDGTTSV